MRNLFSSGGGLYIKVTHNDETFVCGCIMNRFATQVCRELWKTNGKKDRGLLCRWREVKRNDKEMKESRGRERKAPEIYRYVSKL